MLTTRSNHLWKVAIPQGLGRGVHTAIVRSLDAYGNEYKESFVFEIVDERPEVYARVECHQSTASAGATGTPVAECN